MGAYFYPYKNIFHRSTFEAGAAETLPFHHVQLGY